MNILRKIANALSGTVFYFVRGAVCKLAFVVCALSGLFPVFALEKRSGGGSDVLTTGMMLVWVAFSGWLVLYRFDAFLIRTFERMKTEDAPERETGGVVFDMNKNRNAEKKQNERRRLV